jgi:hypothetical protein
MDYIKEDKFLDLLDEGGIELCEDKRLLCYMDEEAVRGFDFANLDTPDLGNATVGEREEAPVERAMLENVFDLISALGLYPAYLMAIDDEWIDDDELAELVAANHLSKDEAAAYASIIELGHTLDVIKLIPADRETAIHLLLPQLTTLSTSCAVTDREGKALFLISLEDEVSFNTTDMGVYKKARAFMEKREANLPFEIIWGD